VYTSTRVEELLASGSCSVAVGTSPDVWKVAREYPHIGFVVPREGSFVTIDSCVIPKASYKKDLVYQLLNFLYQPQVIHHNSIRYGFCSPRTDMNAEVGIYCPDARDFEKLQFFKNVLSKKQLQDAWIAVKAR